MDVIIMYVQGRCCNSQGFSGWTGYISIRRSLGTLGKLGKLKTEVDFADMYVASIFDQPGTRLFPTRQT